MKKFLAIAFISLLLLVGCGSTKTMTCTTTETDEEGYKTETVMKIKYDDKQVLEVEEKATTEMDATYLDFTYNFANSMFESMNEIKGVKASATKNDNSITMAMTVNFKDLDVDAFNEAFGDLGTLEVKDTTISIEEFKDQNLEGYTCK